MNARGLWVEIYFDLQVQMPDQYKHKGNTSLMTPFVVTHRFTILQQTKKNLTDPQWTNIKHVMFLLQFSYGHNIFTEGVFVTQLSC